jgi:hypothetical protein
MSPTPVKVGWQAGPTERGTLTLLYSCLITIFACTWSVLHLNVPGLDDGFWTKALRKAKWMAITVLFPEFIFSKAICELRLALHDLHKFQDALKEKYKDGIRWSVSDSNGQYTQEWSWEVQYGPHLRRLSWLLGLPRPSFAQNSGINDTARIEMNKTAAIISASEQPLESGRPETRGTQDIQVSRPSKTGDAGKDEIEERDVIRIEEALPSGKPCAISTAKNAQEKINQTENVEMKDDQEEGAGRCESSHEQRSIGGDRTSKLNSTDVLASREEPKDETKRDGPAKERHPPQDWTLTHSYFVNMGGLVYLDPLPTLRYTTLTGVKLRGDNYFRLFHNDTFHPLKGLVLDRKDIEDQSKADVLLRALAVLQITWIILTVLVRGVTGLPLTQLEIATLAFSIFAILTYAANWWKPKDVSRPIQLQFIEHGTIIVDASNFAPDCAQSFTLRLKAPTRASGKAQYIPDEPRIRNDMIWMEGNVPLIFSIMAGSALIFGGLHCLAWNFEFPSHAELILWRTASLISAILPLLQVVFSLCLTYLATSYADYKLASFLMTHLQAWNRFPPEYRKSLKTPTFDKGTWETNPLTRDYLELFCSLITDLIEGWEQNTQERTRVPSRWRGLAGLFTWVKDCSSTELLKLWNSFEDSLRSQYRASGTTIPKGFVTLLFEVIAKYDIEKRRDDKWRKACNQASRFFIISIGIVYIASRLIIIVLLFTCLRAVPEGVYENRPWTRFLPNFS